jgi:hypothetical protein
MASPPKLEDAVHVLQIAKQTYSGGQYGASARKPLGWVRERSRQETVNFFGKNSSGKKGREISHFVRDDSPLRCHFERQTV